MSINDIIPTVFISYAWEDEQHKQWVKQLADILIKNRIDAKIDQYDLSLGDRLPEFMEQSISQSDFVLIICTPEYKEKSDSRIGGVGYEGHIISDELFSGHNERKFIPIIRKGTFTTSVPKSLSGKLGVDLTDNDKMEEGLRLLIDTLLGKKTKPVIDSYEVTSDLTASSLDSDGQKKTDDSFRTEQIADYLKEGLQLDIKSIYFNNSVKRYITHKDIRIKISTGTFALLIGGVGSGKTAFLHSFPTHSAYSPKIDGKIVFKGSNLLDESTYIRKNSCSEIAIIPQTMTKTPYYSQKNSVYDYLYKEAKKKHKSYTLQDLHNKVEEALEIAELKGVAQTPVCSCSIGQVKRVETAYQLINDANIFLLDEPDSGVDGVEAKIIMLMLKKVAQKNKIVITSSLAPDRCFDLYDKVIVFARSTLDNTGHLAFYGRPVDACAFFDVDCLEGIIEKVTPYELGGCDMADIYLSKYKSMMEKSSFLSASWKKYTKRS